jgi:hypothetical protein
MERIQFKKEYKLAKGGSERGDLLERFMERLNAPRIQAGFRPLSYGRLSALLAHLEISDLYAFYKQCEAYKGPFSKCFWGALKVRK